MLFYHGNKTVQRTHSIQLIRKRSERVIEWNHQGNQVPLELQATYFNWVPGITLNLKSKVKTGLILILFCVFSFAKKFKGVKILKNIINLQNIILRLKNIPTLYEKNSNKRLLRKSQSRIQSQY